MISGAAASLCVFRPVSVFTPHPNLSETRSQKNKLTKTRIIFLFFKKPEHKSYGRVNSVVIY